uniref:Minichromosome maintenance domain-containing protein 2 n=1 Tax=Leptobrachium leishanense TaxID=445787 RepID=A0A8C5WBZ4_9ANUR
MSWAQSEMREAALVYMDRSGGLKKFIDDCKRYHESTHSYAVYRFVIFVNPMDATELDATLGNYILHEPLRAAQVFQSIHVVLKLSHLPELPGYHLSLSDFPLDYSSHRLYMLEGIVTAMTTVTKYTQAARFLCSETDCPYSKGFHYIRVHVPGATESATVRNDFICVFCASPLKEDLKYRVLGEKQVFDVMDTKALQVFQGCSSNALQCRLQSFAVFVRDELINKMKLGGRYRVVGIPICGPSGSEVTVCIEANNIHQYVVERPQSITGTFSNIRAMTLHSPWIFTGVLANDFASQVVPVGTYNILKLCILLSLVQTSDEEDRETGSFLDLLVITSDTLIIERLMSYSIFLAPRSVRHFPSNDILATISKDDHGTGTASIQAGSAILAKGGICYIGDMHVQKKDKLEHLQSVLESRNTTLFIPGKKYGGECDHQMFIPVQCNFWSYVDSYSKKTVPKENAVIGQVDLSILPHNLIDVFGMLVYVNDFSQNNLVLPVTHHSLSKAVSTTSASWSTSQHFTTEDYKKLIAYAKNLQVKTNARAERLLHGYYLASRRVRTDMNGSKISTSALRHLSSMSEAHAKLSLKQEVTEEDVLIAVLLFETSLILKYGGSVFSVSPNALFPAEIRDERDLMQRDMYLRECHQQLHLFVAAYGPGSGPSINEE